MLVSSHLVDRNFETELRNDFGSRIWELIVGRTLIEAGHNPTNHSRGGPDFSVYSRGAKVWIEATAPSRGRSVDRVPEIVPNAAEAREVPSDKVVLRLTAAILEKSKQRERHLRAGKVSDHDPYIIALSGSKIDETFGSFPSYGLRSTLGWSDRMLAFDSKTGQLLEERLQRKETILKVSGASVSACPFLDSSFDGISAIIWSSADIRSFKFEIYEDLEVIHNPYAKNPLSVGFLPQAAEYWTICGAGDSGLATSWLGPH